jgi:hypothetical protein
MFVTFLMAYLEDALVILADKNKSLLKELPSIDSSRIFESDSIDEIRGEIKKAWAESFLRGTGPVGWSKRFDKLGARGFTIPGGTSGGRV